MAIFTVTTAADAVDASDGVLSLREAVQQANAAEGADDIRFAAILETQTLTLTQGQLTLTGATTIDGNADNNASRITISGGDQSRVLEISGRSSVDITDVVVSNGRVP
jgi:CSLREA domain-containing protein